MNKYIGYDENAQIITISSNTACEWFCVVTNGNIQLDNYNGSFHEQNGGKITLNPSLPQHEDEGFGTIECYFNDGICQVKRTVDIKIKSTVFYPTKKFITFKGKKSYAELELLLTNNTSTPTKLQIGIIYPKNNIIKYENVTENGLIYENEEFNIIISSYDESLRGFHISIISKTDYEFIGEENAQKIIFLFNNQYSYIIVLTQIVEDNDKDYFQISSNDIYVTNLQPYFKVNVINVINGYTQPYDIIPYDETNNTTPIDVDINASNFTGYVNGSSTNDYTYLIKPRNDSPFSGEILTIYYDYVVDPTDEIYITSINGYMWGNIEFDDNNLIKSENPNQPDVKIYENEKDKENESGLTCVSLFFTKKGCKGIDEELTLINDKNNYYKQTINVLYDKEIILGIKSETSKWNVIYNDESVSCVKENTNDENVDNDILKISLNEEFYNQPTENEDERYIKLQNQNNAIILINIQIAEGLANEEGIQFGFYSEGRIVPSQEITISSTTQAIQVISFSDKNEIAVIDKKYTFINNSNVNNTITIPTLYYRHKNNNDLRTVSVITSLENDDYIKTKIDYTYQINYNENINKYYITYGSLQDKVIYNKENNIYIYEKELKDTNIIYFKENTTGYEAMIPTPTEDKEVAWYLHNRGNGVKFDVYRYNENEWILCNDEIPISSGGTKSNTTSEYKNDDIRRIYVGQTKPTNNIKIEGIDFRDGDVFLYSNRQIDKTYTETIILKQYQTLNEIILYVQFLGKEKDNKYFYVSETNKPNEKNENIVNLEIGYDGDSKVAYYANYTLSKNGFTYTDNKTNIYFRNYISGTTNDVKKINDINNFKPGITKTSITTSSITKNVLFDVIDYTVNINGDIYELDSNGNLVYNKKIYKISQDKNKDGYYYLEIDELFTFHYNIVENEYYIWVNGEKIILDINDFSFIYNDKKYYVNVTFYINGKMNILSNIEDDENETYISGYTKEQYVILEEEKIIFNNNNECLIGNDKYIIEREENGVSYISFNKGNSNGKILNGILKPSYNYIIIDYIEYPIENNIIVYNGKKYNIANKYMDNETIIIDNYGYHVYTKNSEYYFLINNQKCFFNKSNKNILSINYNYYPKLSEKLCNVYEIYNENYKFTLNLNNLLNELNVTSRITINSNEYKVSNAYITIKDEEGEYKIQVVKSDTPPYSEIVKYNGETYNVLIDAVVIDDIVYECLSEDNKKVIIYNNNKYYVYDNKLIIGTTSYEVYEKCILINKKLYKVNYFEDEKYGVIVNEKDENGKITNQIVYYVEKYKKGNNLFDKDYIKIENEYHEIRHYVYVPTYSGTTNTFENVTEHNINVYPYRITLYSKNNDEKTYHTFASITYVRNLAIKDEKGYIVLDNNSDIIYVENDKFEINIKRYQVIDDRNSNAIKYAVTSEFDNYLVKQKDGDDIITQSIYDWTVDKYLRKIRLAESCETYNANIKMTVTLPLMFNVEKKQKVNVQTLDNNKVTENHYLPILYNSNREIILNEGESFDIKSYNTENNKIETNTYTVSSKTLNNVVVIEGVTYEVLKFNKKEDFYMSYYIKESDNSLSTHYSINPTEYYIEYNGITILPNLPNNDYSLKLNKGVREIENSDGITYLNTYITASFNTKKTNLYFNYNPLKDNTYYKKYNTLAIHDTNLKYYITINYKEDNKYHFYIPYYFKEEDTSFYTALINNNIIINTNDESTIAPTIGPSEEPVIATTIGPSQESAPTENDNSDMYFKPINVEFKGVNTNLDLPTSILNTSHVITENNIDEIFYKANKSRIDYYHHLINEKKSGYCLITSNLLGLSAITSTDTTYEWGDAVKKCYEKGLWYKINNDNIYKMFILKSNLINFHTHNYYALNIIDYNNNKISLTSNTESIWSNTLTAPKYYRIEYSDDNGKRRDWCVFDGQTKAPIMEVDLGGFKYKLGIPISELGGFNLNNYEEMEKHFYFGLKAYKGSDVPTFTKFNNDEIKPIRLSKNHDNTATYLNSQCSTDEKYFYIWVAQQDENNPNVFSDLAIGTSDNLYNQCFTTVLINNGDDDEYIYPKTFMFTNNVTTFNLYPFTVTANDVYTEVYKESNNEIIYARTKVSEGNEYYEVKNGEKMTIKEPHYKTSGEFKTDKNLTYFVMASDNYPNDGDIKEKTISINNENKYDCAIFNNRQITLTNYSGTYGTYYEYNGEQKPIQLKFNTQYIDLPCHASQTENGLIFEHINDTVDTFKKVNITNDNDKKVFDLIYEVEDNNVKVSGFVEDLRDCFIIKDGSSDKKGEIRLKNKN